MIGGGAVAERKIQALLERGAKVKVISPALTTNLTKLAESDVIQYEKREASGNESFEGCLLAFVATDDPALNGKLASGAKKAGALVNAVDAPAQCDFTIPSIIERGDIMLTISTAGKSPALSKKLRLMLEEHIGEEYATLLEILAAVRETIMASETPSEERSKLLSELVASEIVDKVKSNDLEAINEILSDILGEAYSLEGLGLHRVFDR